MYALIYLLKRTVINYFKRMKEHPQRSVGPIFTVLWIFIFLFSFNFSKGKKHQVLTQFKSEVLISVFVGILILIFLYSLYEGTKKIRSRFQMCDVNLIFTSPIRPQTVLMYGIIKEIALDILASVYIVYQIPNALKEYNIPVLNQVLLIISFLIFQYVFCSILKLLIFALNTKYSMLGEIIRDAIKAAGVICAVSAVMIFIKGNAAETFKGIAHSVAYDKWFGYIPFVGWMRNISYQTLTGINITYAVYIILFAAVSILMLYVTYNIKLDYYEDMLSSAERVQNIVQGRKTPALFKPFKNIKLNLDGVYGAKVIFYKHMNEYKKRSVLFFINFYSIILLISSILLGIFASKVQISIIFFVVSSIMFFTAGFGGKIYYEIMYNFIFLIPDKPQKKLFYGILSSVIKVFTDSLLVFIPFGILAKVSIIEVILCILCYTAFGIMISYSGLFAFRIGSFLGFTGSISGGIFLMLFQFIIMGAAVFITVLLTVIIKGLPIYVMYIGILVFSIAAGFLLSLGCSGILNNKES